MINDSDLKRILESGPATLSQISHKLIEERPTDSPARIYHDVNIKAHKLVKYRHLVTIQHDGREYFALPDNLEITNPDIGPRPIHKIGAYIESLPEGATFTYRDITARFGVSRSTAYTSLKNAPNVRKSRDRPAIFVKGA